MSACRVCMAPGHEALKHVSGAWVCPLQLEQGKLAMVLEDFSTRGLAAQAALDELAAAREPPPGGPSAEVAALRVARESLANAIGWLQDMHPTKSRIARLNMYQQAHAAVAYVLDSKRGA